LDATVIIERYLVELASDALFLNQVGHDRQT
jgi:hypothetical protein